MISQRISAIREELGLSQKDFANQLDVSFRTLQNYEYGKTSPSYDFLKKLSQHYNIAMSYFMDDEIRQLDSSTRFVNRIRQSDLDSSLIPKSQDDSIRIPVFDDVYASAGHGFINEEHISRHIEVDKDSLRAYFGLTSFNDLSIINARGDSMLPTIPPNCQLLIQKGLPREEQICVTRIDDELYIKRLQKLPRYKLISDNKSYDDIDLDGRDYEILGIVVGMFQKMT